MKLVYLSYEKDMMASLGIETVLLKQNEAIEPTLKGIEERGVSIIYVSEAVFQDHRNMINRYQLENELNFCVMGHEGALRMKTFTHQTLGLKTKKEESH